MTVEEINTGNTRLNEARRRWTYVRECPQEKKFREGALSDLKYFTGEDQGWDEDNARSQLKEEGRPAVTLNRIAPIYRLICGARPRAKATYSAVEDGDVETADILAACKEHVDDQNRWDFYEDDWFFNGLLLRRGVVEIRPNYNMDVRGDVELVLHDGYEFYFDPDSKRKDRHDGRYMFREVNIPPQQAKQYWPEYADKLDQLVEHVQSGEGEEVSRDSMEADEYQDPRSNYYDAGSKKLKIIYYWYKEKERVSYVVDILTQNVFQSGKTKNAIEKELAASGAPDRFSVVEVEYTRVKYMIFCHDIVLEEGLTPWEREDGQRTLLSEQIPFICFEPERIFAGTRKELIAIGEALKDPQKYHNKLASAILSIIGTSAHAGWEYEEGAISKEQEKKLKKYGSKPGVHIKWRDGALTQGRTRKIQPTLPPNAHMYEAREMANELLDISGVESLVSTESLGKGASGKAIALKQTQGGNIISWVYRSFRFFQHLLAEYERDAIQAMYNYEKVIRIRGTKPRYLRINQTIYDESGGIQAVLNDVTTGKYDVKVTDKELFPTERVERFHDFVELVRSGALPLPPQVLVKIVMHLLDDPDLKHIVEEEFGQYVQAGAGAQEQSVAQ